MPDEFWIVSVVFGSGLIFMKMIFDYARFKQEQKARRNAGVEANSIRVSELQEMIRDSVDTAIRPLEKRIRRLESPGDESASTDDTDHRLLGARNHDGLNELESDLDVQRPKVKRL